MLTSVVQVKPTREFKVYVYFADGHIKLFDMLPFIGHGVFQRLADIDIFMDKCTVINHTLAWDLGGNFNEYECLDIDPETVFDSGVEVQDPLADGAA